MFLGQLCYGQKVLNTAISDKDLVIGITQTPDGFYWFGNSSGLHRSDGHQSTRFLVNDLESDIQHDQFVSSGISLDARNIYWFSTSQALHALDPQSGNFTTFKVSLNNRPVETGYNAFYYDEQREEILLKADSSIFAFDTRSHTHRLLLEHSDANEIHPLKDGTSLKFYGAPWWNADGLEYFEYKSGAITNFRHLELPIMVKYAAPYTRDSIFLATSLGLQLLTKPSSYDDWNLEIIIPGDSYNVTISTDRKTVFTGVAGKGISAYNLNSKEIIAIWDSSSGLRSDDARILTPDKKGNIFVSLKLGGIDIITPRNELIRFWRGWEEAPLSDIIALKSKAILSIDETGNLFVLGKRNENDWQPIKPFPGATPIDKAKLGRAQDGSIHIHGKNGFASLDSIGEPFSYRALETSIYHGVLAFKDGERLILAENGIISISGNQDFSPAPGLPNGPNNYFTNIVKITENRFLACYRQVELWDIIRDGDSWEVQSKQSLPGEMQAAIAVKDIIYLGTSSGLLTYSNDSLSLAFNPTSTTGNLWINALHQDPTGRLWLGTEQGLFCYYPETGEHLYFSEADGMEDDWFIRANVISDSTSFTMATKTGLVTVDTRLADAKTSDNKIYLTDIWINGIRKTDHSIYAPQALDLDFHHNAISFQPGMIELSSSSLSGFRYQLEGLEEEYTYSKAGEVVRYPSIPPGDYTFRFVGVDKNGRNTEAFTLPVTISPPFYQTWWFWTICGTSVFALFYYFNRRIVQQETARQQAIQKEEARKADETLKRHQAVVREQRRIMMELHDDLGGTLGSLFYTLDGYLLDKESGLPVSPDFELLKNTSGNAMKKLREVMKNNIARELPLPVFVRTLMEQARAMASNSRLNWELEKDDQFPELQLTSRQVHNALLIVKEALQNIRKHAQAKSFTLKLHLEQPDTTLRITLVDDGTGLKHQDNPQHREDGTGNGLVNMRRRAEDLGGELLLTSPPEGGTTLELSFPLK